MTKATVKKDVSQGLTAISLPELPEETPLPPLGVSRAVAGAEIRRLRVEAATLEREVSNGAVSPSGIPLPYLVERNRELRKKLEMTQEEIADLEGMDDYQARAWAYGRGYR